LEAVTCTAQVTDLIAEKIAGPAVRVILVGDSTLASHNGYGDVLCRYFKPGVQCLNFAKNGRSSLSYRAEGLWQRVEALLQDGAAFDRTYVLIQFGHNDQPGKPGRSTDLTTEFGPNIVRYVDEVQRSGAQPVLITPLTRRSFHDKVLVNDLKPWADATRAVGLQCQVPVVELNLLSAAAVQAMGQVEADELAQEPPSASGPSKFDRTHLGTRGAELFAPLVVNQLRMLLPDMQAALVVPIR
jgi:lysophospholipase L1-like esterase